MRSAKNMADLHSHLLPAVDDGSKTVIQSSEVLESMLASGTLHVCLTPHLALKELEGELLDLWLSRREAAFKELIAFPSRTPTLHLGAELMVDGLVGSGAVLDRRVTLAGSRYLLIEFPPNFNTSTISGLLKSVLARRLVPLLAHVERYASADLKSVFAWREAGAVIQVDSHTLAHGRGERSKKAASFIKEGLVDIIAADNHGDQRSLAAADHFLAVNGAHEQADLLLSVNPLAILADQATEAVPPLRKKSRFFRLRSLFTR